MGVRCWRSRAAALGCDGALLSVGKRTPDRARKPCAMTQTEILLESLLDGWLYVGGMEILPRSVFSRSRVTAELQACEMCRYLSRCRDVASALVLAPRGWGQDGRARWLERPRIYFRSAATRSMPACAHSSSRPGDPETPTAPTTSSPALIGRPPDIASTRLYSLEPPEAGSFNMR